MSPADVRRSWWSGVAVLLGVMAILWSLAAHEQVELSDVGPPATRVVVADTGLFTGPSLAGQVAGLTAAASAPGAPPVALAASVGTAGSELLLHCLGLVAGTCLVVAAATLVWLLLSRPGGVLLVSARAPGAVLGRARPSSPPHGPVRLRLCLIQV